MADTPTHISTSGGMISVAFVENIRELGIRQSGVEPESFALRPTEGSAGSEAEWERPAPKNPAALEQFSGIAEDFDQPVEGIGSDSGE